jgi:hypothetical protein
MDLFGAAIVIVYAGVVVTALVSLYKGSLAKKSQGIKE